VIIFYTIVACQMIDLGRTHIRHSCTGKGMEYIPSMTMSLRNCSFCPSYSGEMMVTFTVYGFELRANREDNIDALGSFIVTKGLTSGKESA
jgi:hypothetical protein